MLEVLLEARPIADMEIIKECRQRQLHEQFPRIASKHQKYESLAPLRQTYRKLKDLSRKYSERDHQERAEVILRQAWDLVRL